MKASAVKRGRNPRFPYVAVIIRADGSTHNTNMKHAFATRDEAIIAAQAWIDRSMALTAAADIARAKRHGVA